MRRSSATRATVRTLSKSAWSMRVHWDARRAAASTGMTMPSGRVFIAGSSGDALLTWLAARLKDAGYTPVVLGEASAGAPISLAPIVAGFDLWRTAGEPRFEALADLDERLPPGRPLL